MTLNLQEEGEGRPREETARLYKSRGGAALLSYQGLGRHFISWSSVAVRSPFCQLDPGLVVSPSLFPILCCFSNYLIFPNGSSITRCKAHVHKFTYTSARLASLININCCLNNSGGVLPEFWQQKSANLSHPNLGTWKVLCVQFKTKKVEPSTYHHNNFVLDRHTKNY